jgi:hypothetical protein
LLGKTVIRRSTEPYGVARIYTMPIKIDVV